MNVSTSVNSPNNTPTNRSYSSRGRLCRYSLSTGTNAALNMPPTRRSYSRTGTWLATRKALTMPVAPKSEAMTISRTSPRMRLAASAQ